jgi:hypothetical protein
MNAQHPSHMPHQPDRERTVAGAPYAGVPAAPDAWRSYRRPGPLPGNPGLRANPWDASPFTTPTPTAAPNWPAPLHAIHPQYAPLPAPPSSAAPRRRRAGTWIAGLAALAALAAVAMGRPQDQTTDATTVTGPTTPTASAPAPVTTTAAVAAAVRADALPGLLLSPAELDATLVVHGLRVRLRLSAPYQTATDQPDCGSVSTPAMAQGYGPGYTAMQVQSLDDAVDDNDAGVADAVVQAVTAYPSDAYAQAVVATQTDRWTACSDKTITETGINRLNLLTPANDHGMLTVSMVAADTPDYGCQHAMTARRNVVADVRVCTFGSAAQAPDLAYQIAARVGAS